MSKQSDIENILHSGDEETRRVVLETLRGKGLADTCQLLFLAMADNSWRVRKEAVEIFLAAEPAEEHISALLDKLRDEDNAGLRNSAAEAIVRLGNRSVDALLGLSGDKDADVRKFVIDMMGGIGSTVFVPPLLLALHDTDDNVASAAAEQLGNIGNNTVVPELLKSVAANSSTHFRFSALAALGKLSAHTRVADEIIALAKDDILRKAVFDCLGSIGDESATDMLLGGFELHQKKSRAAAIISWYRIYRRSDAPVRTDMEAALRSRSGGEMVLRIIEMFDSGDSITAEAVTALLGIIGDVRGRETLLRAYADARLSPVAATGLKTLANDELDDLIAGFADADETIRYAICKLIAELAYANGSKMIHQAIRDHSPSVRMAAVNAVAGLGMTECIYDLVQLLRDTELDVELAAVACLKSLSKTAPEAIKSASACLAASERPEIRRDAANLLSNVDGGEILSRLAKDEDAAVRQAAVVALGKQPISSNCNLLKAALLDENPDVRIAAAEALATSGCSDIIDLLVHALKDDDAWVQCAVLKSIAMVDKTFLLDAVKSVFHSSDTYLVITCLELLGEIGSGPALELVRSAVESSNRDVSSLARSILCRITNERP